MNWISVEFEGWAATFVVVRSGIGETERYFGLSKKEAEQRYRQKYGLVGVRMRRLSI